MLKGCVDLNPIHTACHTRQDRSVCVVSGLLRHCLSVVQYQSTALFSPPGQTGQNCPVCRVCLGGVNWIPDNSRLSPAENLKSERANSNGRSHVGTPDTTQTGLF